MDFPDLSKSFPSSKVKSLKAKTKIHEGNIFYKTKQLFSWFFRKILFFWRFSQIRTRPRNSFSESKIFPKEVQTPLKFIKTIKLILLVQKAVRNLRNRTTYRNLKLCNTEFEILNDESYFRKQVKKHRLVIIRNKTFRIIKRKFKKIIRRYCVNYFNSKKNYCILNQFFYSEFFWKITAKNFEVYSCDYA